LYLSQSPTILLPDLTIWVMRRISHKNIRNRNCLHFRVITVFTVFRLLTDFVCLYNYEFWLSLCKIVRSSVILLLPLFAITWVHFGGGRVAPCSHFFSFFLCLSEFSVLCLWNIRSSLFLRFSYKIFTDHRLYGIKRTRIKQVSWPCIKGHNDIWFAVLILELQYLFITIIVKVYPLETLEKYKHIPK
jgi:hypothetical protein